MMQKRIDALTVRKLAVNERMEVAKEVGDVQGYQSASGEYNRLAREITWLGDIQSLVRPPIVANDYDELNFDKIAIRLRFGSMRLITPFNDFSVKTEELSPSLTLDTIDIQPVTYQFVYSLRLLEFPPARTVANQLNHEWIESDVRLEMFVSSIPPANAALSYIERASSDYALMQEGIQWAEALYEWQKEKSHRKLMRLMNSDSYMLGIKNRITWCWLMIEQLLYFYLARNQYRIDWRPFSETK